MLRGVAEWLGDRTFFSIHIHAHNWLTDPPTLVSHTCICVSESGQLWFREWLVAYSAPSYYLNQCWLIVNWLLTNKLQWNLNQNINLFVDENAYENIFCEMKAILSRGRWVKDLWILIAEGTYLSPLVATCKSNWIHLAKWRHLATWIWVNICTGNGQMPDGTKPLLDLPMWLIIIEVQRHSSRAKSKEIPQSQIALFSLKITYSKYQSNLLVAKASVHCICDPYTI